MKKTTKLLALVTAFCLLLSLGALAASSEAEYDVNAERQAAFGIVTASGEASGSSEIVYDHYVDESAAYDRFVFDGTSYGAHDGYLTVTVDGV